METLLSPELGQDITRRSDSEGNHGSDRELEFELIGFGADAVPYREAWELQRSVHAQVVAGDRPDTVLLLEHPAVYTAGRRTEPQERPQDGTEVIDVDRGGKITWHGPGQLVGYPIVRLAKPVDVVAYVRRLERMLIGVCNRVGVQAVQVPGRSGVWMPATGEAGAGAPGPARPERKLAAVGIRVAQGVTMHGFSLNCDPDLSVYGSFIPCGITDAGVTSLSAERAGDPSVRRLARVGVADILPPVLEGLRNTDLGGHRS